ncbi:hypothetical protein GA0111570_10340 [Raineyella antarctica]|uniref:Uncharacterized protein n=1 Tax=Raineyella antarctica TaxID=1577474 RepID=A0A1G6GFX1_9ACTN|nr:hypothetical protein [Raineyella antarctica]SDB80723.1 hypothetical protein GA0111570_10340 [Raineyella antarctica]
MAPTNVRIITTAAAAFLLVFLLSGFIVGTLLGETWASSIATASTLGIVGAGMQLMLIAARRRRELEGQFDLLGPEA